MSSRIYSILLAAAVAFPAICHDIKPVESPVSTYVELLKNNGYEAISYDITALRDTTYSFKFLVREYEGDKLVSDGSEGYIYLLKNRTMLSSFSPEFQAEIKAEDMADAASGIYSLAERIDIGLLPPTDSIRQVAIMLPSQGAVFKQLKLKEQHSPDGKQSTNGYLPRPFKHQTFKTDEFIPLMLVGSFWWDPEFEVFRFCGDNVIEPDLSSGIIKNIPHYYVIGMVATQQKDK